MTGLAVSLAGFSTAALGLFWVGAYALRAIEVLDQPDRSFLFWGLAVLFCGIFLTLLGGALVLWGRTMMRAAPRPRELNQP